jgi:hypothetical protein
MDAVADWWLEMAGAVLGDVAAAAAPATTTQRAMVRMTVFMVGYPWWILTHRRRIFCIVEW